MGKNFIILLFLFIVFKINAQNDSINYNLLQAAYEGKQSLLLKSIKDSADIDFQDYDGNTALIYAAKQGHEDIVKILIFNGADIEMENKAAFRALHLAAEYGNNYICNELILAGAKIDANGGYYEVKPIHYATAYNNYELVDMLLFYGADVNAKSKYGDTPLHIASHAGYYAIDSLLIANGADINAKDSYYYFTPLTLAVQNNQLHIVELLLDNGASIEYGEEHNWNDPILFAIDQKNTAILDTLVAKYKQEKITPIHSDYLRHIAEVSANPEIKNSIRTITPNSRNFPIITANIWGLETDWNNTDLIPAFFWGIHEESSNIDITLGYGRRLWRNRILYDEYNDDETYTQYRENRSKVFIKITKKVSLLQTTNTNFGVYGAVRESFSFGNFKATYKKPEAAFYFSPEAGIFLDYKNFRQTIGYHYMKFDKDLTTIPHRISYTMYFYGLFSQYKASSTLQYKKFNFL
jgi:ankyrin repeat protein